jgi:hypothetical protein
MRKILLICLLLIHVQAFAQVDLAAISKEVTSPTSPVYYPTLLKRFQTSDSTLTSQDFLYLYYGFISQPAYKPRTIDTLEVEAKDRNHATDYIGAYELADSVLRFYPVSVGLYLEKSFACYHLRRVEEEQYNRKRYMVLLRTILKNGTGSTMEYAYTVLSYNDMYEVTDYLGLNIEKEERVVENGQHYFLLHPSKNKDKIKHLYFYCTDPRTLEDK